MKFVPPLCAVITLLATTTAGAEHSLHAARIEQPPTIDGHADDAAWGDARQVTVKDGASDTPITLRAVHDGTTFYLLAQFPDPDESRLHKPLRWNPRLGLYDIGPQREDTLILKWNLSSYPVDLTLRGETPYHADVWFWKAHRTDPTGYADDKHQSFGESRMRGARGHHPRRPALLPGPRGRSGNPRLRGGTQRRVCRRDDCRIPSPRAQRRPRRHPRQGALGRRPMEHRIRPTSRHRSTRRRSTRRGRRGGSRRLPLRGRRSAGQSQAGSAAPRGGRGERGDPSHLGAVSR